MPSMEKVITHERLANKFDLLRKHLLIERQNKRLQQQNKFFQFVKRHKF